MEMKLPILAIDVGDKRVGVAIYRDSNSTPIALDCYERANGSAEQKILTLIKELEVALLIVGLPRSDNDEETEQCSKTRKFARRIERRCDVSIQYVDEYGSSLAAKDRLALNSQKKLILARKSGMIDATSASIILETFLSENAVE